MERSLRLPDVAQDTAPSFPGALNKVGMSGIEVALRFRDPESGEVMRTPARADAFVSLDNPAVKGIHMSRLFLKVQETLENEDFGLKALNHLLEEFLASHAGLSSASYLSFEFEHLARRKSLISERKAWRSYPTVVQSCSLDGKLEHHITVRVPYSSTCPCSAALSRQLTQRRFEEEFGGNSLVSFEQVREWLGTRESLGGAPHSQRSIADVTVVLDPDVDRLPISCLVDAIESSLSTAVQAAVKREDEQEFARLNAEHLMFCEDAARRIKSRLDRMAIFHDFRVQASHMESLHPHDAVAIVTKGIPGGLHP